MIVDKLLTIQNNIIHFRKETLYNFFKNYIIHLKTNNNMPKNSYTDDILCLFIPRTTD